MSNELVHTQSHGLQAMQSSGAILPANVNAGAVTIEVERAIAEARGKIQIAKMFPRSEASATSRLLESCKVREFAETAFYSVPNRGSGPSIRFAEEAARVYGNFQYGHRELSRSPGRSEVEVFAWDVENNNYSPRQITVEHVLDSRNGQRKLTDQADIDNRIANVASKQMRGRILALLPKAMVALAIAECRKTLAGDNSEPMAVRVQRMVQAFGKFGVNDKHLSAYIGHTLDAVTSDELADLQGVFNALKDGAKPSEYFELGATTQPAHDLNAAIAANKDKPAQQPAVEQPPKPATTQRTRAAVDKPRSSTPAEAAPAPTQAKAPPPADAGDDRPGPDDEPPADGPLF